MKRLLFIVFHILPICLLIAACGSDAENGSPASGNPARGKVLYQKTILSPRAAPGCITCHSLEAGVTLVGPSHAGVAERAGSMVPGLSAEGYLRESIINPDAHVLEGFFPGIMYQEFGEDLSEQEINDLVAFMLTLK
ncbi:MAG TPA: cytochrome c [Anaerolineales bacterium]|nr:cytochrome c [Anaerolineales bacterium]